MKDIDLDNFEKILQESGNLVEIIEKMKARGYEVNSLEQLLGSTHHYFKSIEGPLAQKLDAFIVDYVKGAPLGSYGSEEVSSYIAFSQKYIEDGDARIADQLSSDLVVNYLHKSKELDVDFLLDEFKSLSVKAESGQLDEALKDNYLNMYFAATQIAEGAESGELNLTDDELTSLKDDLSKLSFLDQMGSPDKELDISQKSFGRGLILDTGLSGQISSTNDDPGRKRERRLEIDEEYSLQDEIERSLYKGAFQKVSTYDKLKKEFSPSDENLPETHLLGTSVIAHRPQFEGGPLVPAYVALNISKPTLGLGGKVSFTQNSKLDPAAHDHAALEVKALGIKKPYIVPPTEYKEASEPFDFIRMSSLALLKAGYDIKDIKVDKKYQSTLDFAYGQYMKLQFKDGGIGAENDLSELELDSQPAPENEQDVDNSLELDEQEVSPSQKGDFEKEIQRDEDLLNRSSFEQGSSRVVKPHNELHEAMGGNPDENDLGDLAESYQFYENSAPDPSNEKKKDGPGKGRRNVKLN